MKLTLTIVLFLLGGCVANTINSRDIESYNNSLIGTQIAPGRYTPKYGWEKVHEDGTSYTVQMTKKNGCSWTIKIDKNNNTVLSWNFIFKREMCDGLYAQTI